MKSWALLLAAGSLVLASQATFAQANKRTVVVKTTAVKAVATRTPVVKPPGAPVVTNPRTPPSRN